MTDESVETLGQLLLENGAPPTTGPESIVMAGKVVMLFILIGIGCIIIVYGGGAVITALKRRLNNGS